MFRRHALRASRTAYLASAGAVGTVVVAEASESGEQSASADTAAPEAPLPSANHDDVEMIAVELELEREPPRTVFPDLPEKLSIYPTPAQTLVLLDTPSPLELQIGRVRRQLCGYYSGARTHVQGVVDRWINVEEAIETRLKSFRDPAEPLNPGMLYTGVSALTTSVVVRSRSLPARIVLPPLSLVGAFAYFLPLTAGRVGGWIEGLESRYVPRVGEIRRTSVAHTGMAFGMLGDAFREGKEGLGRGARSAVEGIECGTGLRLSGALGWDKDGGDKKTGSDSVENGNGKEN